MTSAPKMAMRVILWALANRLPHPRARAIALRWLGANIGKNVRIHPCRLINFESGFSHLRVGNDVYIGADVLLDLAGPLEIQERATISARSCLMTHHDPGASHNNALARVFPPSRKGCQVEADAWIGIGVIVLEGCKVGRRSVVGAGAVVTHSLPSDTACIGIPARVIRRLTTESSGED